MASSAKFKGIQIDANDYWMKSAYSLWAFPKMVVKYPVFSWNYTSIMQQTTNIEVCKSGKTRNRIIRRAFSSLRWDTEWTDFTDHFNLTSHGFIFFLVWLMRKKFRKWPDKALIPLKQVLRKVVPLLNCCCGSWFWLSMLSIFWPSMDFLLPTT